MVRAHVVHHPCDWRFGGYHELTGGRKRYRITNSDRLLRCLCMPDEAEFRRWHEHSLQYLCQLPVPPSEPFWGSALAVGDRPWLRQLTGDDDKLDETVRPADETATADSEHGTWYLHATHRLAKRLMRRM